MSVKELTKDALITPEKTNWNYTGKFDVIVVGSGPGGSVVADMVAGKGRRVCIIEEGDYYNCKTYPDNEAEGYLKMYQDQGMRMSFGNVVMPVLQGKCLGGGMVVNMALCLQPPEIVRKEWAGYGIEWPLDNEWFNQTVDILKEENSIGKVEKRLFTRNHTVFMEAVKAMSLGYEVFERNTDGCEGCGRCNFGCPIEAKVVPHRTYLKRLIEKGGEIIVRGKVKKVLHDGFFVRGVEGVFVDYSGRERGAFHIESKVVCVACGAINTPYLLLSSELPKRQRGIGSMASFHPTFLLFAVFPQRIDGMRGVPMALYSETLFEKGIILETMFLPPLSFSVPMPGVGKELYMRLLKYPQVAMGIIQVRDTSRGRVSKGFMGRPWIEYNLNGDDFERIKEGVEILAKGYLKAGAKKVIFPVKGEVTAGTSEEVDNILKRMELNRFSFFLYSAHPQGGCPMGDDPSKFAVRPSGELYSLRNCFVADSSLFPSPSGVNPMFSIMIFAKKIGENILGIL